MFQIFARQNEYFRFKGACTFFNAFLREFFVNSNHVNSKDVFCDSISFFGRGYVNNLINSINSANNLV